MKSLTKIVNIIELLEKNGEMRLQDISEELGMNKSTAHRFVSSLVNFNFIERNDDTKKYKLGLRFLNIASTVVEKLDIKEISKESAEELNEITKETIHIAMLLGNEVIYIDKKECPYPIRMYSSVGKSVPLYCTGIGKAILAFQPPKILDKLLDSIKFQKHTKNTILTKNRLAKELEETRERGYSIDDEEHEENTICIGAPIRDYSGKVIASISISAITYRMQLKELLSYKDLLLEKSEVISKRLGYKNCG